MASSTAWRAECAKLLDNFTANIKAEFPETAFTACVAVGDPRYKLIDDAKSKNSDIIVIGRCYTHVCSF